MGVRGLLSPPVRDSAKGRQPPLSFVLPSAFSLLSLGSSLGCVPVQIEGSCSRGLWALAPSEEGAQSPLGGLAADPPCRMEQWLGLPHPTGEAPWDFAGLSGLTESQRILKETESSPSGSASPSVWSPLSFWAEPHCAAACLSRPFQVFAHGRESHWRVLCAAAGAPLRGSSELLRRGA